MEEVRLQKFLAEQGIASRRKCEELILAGKVTVNGNVVPIGTKIQPQVDKVCIEGKPIILSTPKPYTYILLNKPIGVVTTVKDQFQRPCVLDLVKVPARIVPVGRLDMYTSGALLLSDDGAFIYRVTHPKHEITKMYTVTLRGKIADTEIKQLEQGVCIDENYITKPAKVRILKIDTEKNVSRIEICIHEGKNRQVRKMCEAVGKKVLALHRSKIGNLAVKDLKVGEWRYLRKEEIAEIS